MKLTEIAQSDRLPTTVGEYIKKYDLHPGPFSALDFQKPNAITSWEGTPNMLLYLSPANTQLTTLEGLTLFYVQTFDTRNSEVRDFRNFHEHVKRCDFLYAHDDTVNMLGTLLSVTKVSKSVRYRYILVDEIGRSNNKMSFLFDGLLELDDINEAQERLIAAGYEEQAGI